MANELPVHVWTCVTGRWGTDAAPGLLLEWRQREGVGWEGWVIAADPARGGATEASVRQSWVPATAIRPLQEAGPDLSVNRTGPSRAGGYPGQSVR